MKLFFNLIAGERLVFLTSFKLKLKRLVIIIIFRPLGLCRLKTIKYRFQERETNDTRGQSDTLDDWVLFENLRSAITRETKKEFH